MAGSFDWLDTLAQRTGDVLGRAVEAAGNARIAEITAGARVPDQTPVPATSPVQVAVTGGTIPVQYIVLGVAVLLGVAFAVSAMRKG